MNLRTGHRAFLARTRQRAQDFQAFLEQVHWLYRGSHVRVHWLMFAWGVKRRDAPEVLGQVVRLIGAATKTAIGLVPSGNTGGSNISPVQRVPIPADLAAIIEATKRG
jgi:hypothetical protein